MLVLEFAIVSLADPGLSLPGYFSDKTMLWPHASEKIVLSFSVNTISARAAGFAGNFQPACAAERREVNTPNTRPTLDNPLASIRLVDLI
jgi:hypothetical protein